MIIEKSDIQAEYHNKGREASAGSFMQVPNCKISDYDNIQRHYKSLEILVEVRTYYLMHARREDVRAALLTRHRFITRACRGSLTYTTSSCSLRGEALCSCPRSRASSRRRVRGRAWAGVCSVQTPRCAAPVGVTTGKTRDSRPAPLRRRKEKWKEGEMGRR